MKRISILLYLFLLLSSTGCDKKNDDVVEPLSASAFPQVIKFDDEGDGDLEDADEFSFKLTLNDRPDSSGEELAGKIVPLTEDVTVFFEIKEWEGFSKPGDYIKKVKALYEIDDCTTSEDAGINLNIVFNTTTGKGSVRFPKGIEEIEVIFETDEDYFNDNLLNDKERSITMVITGTQPEGKNVTFNSAAEFKYEVLDEEGIHGDWELDHENAIQFAAFKKLFSLISEDVESLDATDIDKIEISIEYNDVKVVIELKEKEMVEECGSVDEKNKVIEIEADLEELSTLTSDGDIEFAGEIEQSNGSVKEFVYKGDFTISGSALKLILTGEYDDKETDKVTLLLKK